MSSSSSEAVKELAIAGKFDEIAKNYGDKRRSKAESYVEAKLKSLQEKQLAGESLEEVRYATPFMLFAADQIEKKSLSDLAAEFRTNQSEIGSQISSEIESIENCALSEDNLVVDDGVVVAGAQEETVVHMEVEGEEGQAEFNDEENEEEADREGAPCNDQDKPGDEQNEIITPPPVTTKNAPANDATTAGKAGGRFHTPQQLTAPCASTTTSSSNSSSSNKRNDNNSNAKGFRPPTATTTKPASINSSSETIGAQMNNLDQNHNQKKSKKRKNSTGQGEGEGDISNTSKKTKATKEATTKKAHAKKPAKPAKDPNAPKGAKSSYFFFAASVRKDIQTAGGGAIKNVVEVARETAQRWKMLDDAAKSVYVEMATADKQRYSDEMVAYRELHPEAADAIAANRRRGRDNKKAKSSTPSTSSNRAARKKNHTGNNSRGSGDRTCEQDGRGAGSFDTAGDENDASDGDESDTADTAASADDTNKPRRESIRRTCKSTTGKGKDEGEGENSQGEEDEQDHLQEQNSEGDSQNEGQRRIKGKAKFRPPGCISSQSLGEREQAKSKKTKKNNRTQQPKKCASIPIKQDELPQEADLLHSKLMPYALVEYPVDITFHVGQALTLVLEPYRAFISQLPADCALDADTYQDIQLICSLPRKSVVHGKLEAFRNIPNSCCPAASSQASPGEQVEAEVEAEAQSAIGRADREIQPSSSSSSTSTPECYTLLSIAVHGKSYDILYAPFSSSLLTSDKFLIETTEFKSSLAQPWLVVSAQVRLLFAANSGEEKDEEDVESNKAEVREASIYHIREDVATNPYQAVSVIFLRQEEGTRDWLYDYAQCDCECSPWDLELSHYVLLKNIRSPKLPRSLLVGSLQASTVLAYIKTFDAAGQFLEDMSQCRDTQYCALVANPDDRLDLKVITKWCRQGRYDEESMIAPTATHAAGTSTTTTSRSSSSSERHSTSPRINSRVTGIGVATLFEDLQKMVDNSKRFNDSNRDFTPWRVADMMEKTILWVKHELATHRALPCLQHSLTADLEEQEEELLQTQEAVDL